MLRIDIHTHILPREWPDLRERYGYGGFIRLDHQACGAARIFKDDAFFREVAPNCWDGAVRIRECDKSNVNVQVLSTVPVMFSYWAKPDHALDLSRLLNDHIAGLVREYPTRFVGLGTVPMQAPDLAIRELERCVKELGLAGIEIGSHVNDWNLNDPAVFDVFAAAEDMGAAVFVHPWDMMGTERMGRYWLPWLVGMPAETCLAICSMIFGGVFERLPRLRVAFAHAGGSFPGTLGRIEHGFNVRPDLCAIDNPVNPREYLGRFWVDSLVHDSEMLDRIVDLFGPDRVALGTDYPFPLGELEPGRLIDRSSYSDATRKQLLAGAALEWLGLDASMFEEGRQGHSI